MRFSKILDDQLSRTQRNALKRYLEQSKRVLGAIASYPSALLGFIIVCTFVIMAVFANQIAPYDPMESHYANGQPLVLESPSWSHPLGTTNMGRDVLSQFIYGARVSLFVGVIAGISVAVIGTTVGLLAGYLKGTADLVIMRVVDILYGIPATPLVLVVAMFAGGSIWAIIGAVVLVMWRSMARVVRSQTLSIAERPFVKSAQAAGASTPRILYLHIAPNLLPIIMIETILIVGYAIVLEAGVSFLGVGSQSISWGTMLQLTFDTGAIRFAWWWVIPPGIGITVFVMSLFYIARAIEDISNPELSK